MNRWKFIINDLGRRLEAVIPNSECRFKPDGQWSKCTTMGAGTASFPLLEVSSAAALQCVASKLLEWEIPVRLFQMGYGSNLIGTDSEIPDCMFVRFSRGGDLCGMRSIGEDGMFSCGAGCSFLEFSRFCLQNGFGGVAELCGIPGSIGGMTRMNAGALGKSIFDFIENITLLDLKTGQVVLHPKTDFSYVYRNSGIPTDTFVLSVTMRLEKVDPQDEQQKIEAELVRRKKAPKGRSAGSIFRNPAPDMPAGKLLEAIGAKNMKSGSFFVSPEHANWIINGSGVFDTATEDDFVDLLGQMRLAVWKSTGIQLYPEVKFVNQKTEQQIQDFFK